MTAVAEVVPSSLLGGRGSFVDWGVVQLSVANLVVVALMVGVFLLAVLVPFPGRHRSGGRRRK